MRIIPKSKFEIEERRHSLLAQSMTEREIAEELGVDCLLLVEISKHEENYHSSLFLI